MLAIANHEDCQFQVSESEFHKMQKLLEVKVKILFLYRRSRRPSQL